jgi:hypothetical protein
MEPLFTLLDATAKEVEEFLLTVTVGIEFLAEVLVETVDEATDQVLHTLGTEIEPQVHQWLIEPLMALLIEVEGELNDLTTPFTPPFHPSINQHPACVGCRHYHGQIYGETLLVCGMHPYGWDGETCPDHESMS